MLENDGYWPVNKIQYFEKYLVEGYPFITRFSRSLYDKINFARLMIDCRLMFGQIVCVVNRGEGLSLSNKSTYNRCCGLWWCMIIVIDGHGSLMVYVITWFLLQSDWLKKDFSPRVHSNWIELDSYRVKVLPWNALEQHLH